MHRAANVLPPSSRRPRGAALLAAMLTVAMVATLASAALWQQWRDVEIETAERNRMQAGWLLLGALDWSRVVLQEDARANRSQPIDHLGEPWAVPLEEARLSTFLAAQNNVVQVDDGLADIQQAFLSGEIVDLQSRLNLRNLLGAAPDADSYRAFIRLFERLGIPVSEVSRLALALQQASSKEPSANAALLPRTVRQLAWLGVAPQWVARMEPFVTLLPEATPVNLNTASAEVLWASIPDLDWAKANELVQLRSSTPFQSVGAASQALQLTQAISASSHSVFTRYFEARGRLRLGDNVLSERSVLLRDGSSVTTVWHERGDWGMPVTHSP